MPYNEMHLLWQTGEALSGSVRLVATYENDQLTGMLLVYPETRPKPFEGIFHSLQFDVTDVRRIRSFTDNILPDDLGVGVLIDGDPAGLAIALPRPSDPPSVRFREDLPKGPSWGFWDETWGEFFAGFETEEAARAGFSEYCDHLQTGEAYCADNPNLYWTR